MYINLNKKPQVYLFLKTTAEKEKLGVNYVTHLGVNLKLGVNYINTEK